MLDAEITKEDSYQALAEILASETLKRSDQLRAVLKYVCESAIEGREQQISEYVLGVEVLHRQPSYSPAEDSVVRTRVYELRQKLKHYYEIENPSARVRIEIPKGGYVPRFFAQGADAPAKKGKAPRGKWRVGSAIALAAIAASALLLASRDRPSNERKVWKPLISSGAQPILISLGETPAKPDGTRESLNAAGAPPKPNHSRRVGTGAAISLFRLGALFDRLHAPSQLRLSTATSFTDLHRYPTVLLGAFTNQFTLEISHDLSYHFEYRFGSNEITDGKDPSSQWRLLMDGQGNILRDYGIAARLMPNESHQGIMIAAGLEQCGTAASSEILADGLPQLIQKLPTGWENKNFEAVVSVQVVDGNCGAPEILRLKVW